MVRLAVETVVRLAVAAVAGQINGRTVEAGSSQAIPAFQLGSAEALVALLAQALLEVLEDQLPLEPSAAVQVLEVEALRSGGYLHLRGHQEPRALKPSESGSGH